MKSKLFKLSLVLLGIILFDLLFWEQLLGLNLSLFCAFLCLLGLLQKPILNHSKESLLAFTAVAITAFTSVWHHSSLSICMLILSSLIFMGFLKQSALRSTFSSLLVGGIHFLSIPLSVLRSFKKVEQINSGGRILGRVFGYGFIPLIIFLIFFFIYRQANPKFEVLTQKLVEAISSFFAGFELGRFFFLLFGLALISCSLLPSYFSFKSWLKQGDDLIRAKNPNSSKITSNSMASLIFENRTAMIILAALNLLLLVINLIDLDWVWFGFEVPRDFNLKQFVHEGTYLLILSILLSIGILLYFFRGSLNFYPKNKTLLLLAKVWILQNALLCASVFIRNYHYIDYHGLASKRIGVIAFLLMTFFGLATLWIKIDRKKSFSYLLRSNSWFVFFTLVLMSCLQWDRIIAVSNLNHHNAAEIDVDHYLNLDPVVAPILFKNLDRIEDQMQAHLDRENKTPWLSYTNIDDFKAQLEYRVSNRLRYREKANWQAWNYADYRLEKSTYLVE